MLLGHVIQDPGGPRVQEDLNLLRELVSYFSRLAVQMKLVSEMADKLRRTAELFYQLAVRYTQSSVTAAGPGPPLGPRADAGGATPDGIGGTHGPALQFQAPAQIGPEQDFDFLVPNDQEVERLLSWLPDDLGLDMGLMANPTESTGIESGLGEPTARQSRGQKRPFDAMFDWFAWENYYYDGQGTNTIV